jgi:hypothetical protein
MKPKPNFSLCAMRYASYSVFLSQSRALRTMVLHPSSHFSTARHGTQRSVNLIFISHHALKWRFHFGAAKRQKFVSGVIIQKSGQICPAHTAWVKFALFLCVFIGIMHEMWKRADGRPAGAGLFLFLSPPLFLLFHSIMRRGECAQERAEGLLLFLYEVSW